MSSFSSYWQQHHNTSKTIYQEYKDELIQALDYLRTTVVKPPYNYKWMMPESSDKLADLILSLNDDTIAIAHLEPVKNAEIIHHTVMPNGDDATQEAIAALDILIENSIINRTSRRKAINLSVERPEFALYDLSGDEPTEPFIELKDFNRVIKYPYKIKQPNTVLNFWYSCEWETWDPTLVQVKQCFNRESFIKDIQAFQHMVKNTWEDTIAALRLYGATDSQITLFKVVNGLSVSDDELNDETLVGLI